MALVTLVSYRDPIDAALAKTRLESAGIQALVFDEHLAGIQWLYSRAVGGVKVKVEQADVEAARRVLREDRSADLTDILESHLVAADGDGCPRCGAISIRTSHAHRVAAALSLATGLPLFPWHRRWVCRQCGHQWEWERARTEDMRPETLEAERLVHERHTYISPRAVALLLIAAAILFYIRWRIHST